ncbi:hypothetical protein [Undibacterium sp.]|uniref:hypothetical protein n=1 Tax=Undibacterium sp. TaxID=1914977 RepID=UPI002D0A73C8|nr:hypothetical protein [Undibacterium sp.]HTD05321.1 hypothetical protein [Undibacterium sp.]
MKKYLVLVAGLAATAALTMAAVPALAAPVRVDLNIGVPYEAPVYVQQQPVYVQPESVYVQPQPVYVQPGYGYYDRDYAWRRHEWRERQWREHERREHEWREHREEYRGRDRWDNR